MINIFKNITVIILFALSILTSVYAQTADTYIDSAKEKYDNKDYKGAIQDFTKAIELNPKFADAYSNRGVVKGNLQDYRGAIQDYNKAIELNPN